MKNEEWKRERERKKTECGNWEKKGKISGFLIFYKNNLCENKIEQNVKMKLEREDE